MCIRNERASANLHIERAMSSAHLRVLKIYIFFTLYIDNYQFSLLIGCCWRTSPLSMCVIYNSNNRYKIVNAFERRIYHNTNDGKYYQVYISYCTRCVIPIEFINGETSQDFNNFDCMIEIYQP